MRGGLTRLKPNVMRFTLFLFTLLALSCSKTDDISSPCMSGDCDARLILDYPQDTNGYYHVDLNFNAEYYPRFNIFVEADDLLPEYRYNGVSVIEGRFDTDTYWTVDGELNFKVPLYNPWLSLSQYNGTPIPINSKNVSLTFFDGIVIPVVQRDTRVYLQPSQKNKVIGKRIVGPISPTLVNDTITIFSEVFWEAGSKYEYKDDLFVKIIIK